MYNRSVLLNLSKTKSIDIQFVDLVYEVRDGFRGSKKQILKGINGLFKSGDMTAIMGPSGAGKSTLLNILTGFKQDKSLKGEINYLNNKGNNESWNEYKKHSCYILQEDQLPNLFTVNEAMMISANLKLGNSLNRKAKQILIDDILDTLDLIHAKKTLTNKLSGGQKKRLSIALELVDNPPVMFLDEPTTGLDSSSSLQCVTMLQKLAKGGRTIICTIHQPSAAIYKMFDHVYLLADGRCMYEGAAQVINSLFRSNQPLDWYRFLMYFGIFVLTVLIADSFGLVIGTLVNPVNGTFISVVIFSMFIIFAGFFIFFNHMPKYLYYVSYLNYMRYALEGLLQSLYGYNREKLNCPDLTYCHFRIPQMVFIELGMTNTKYWFDVIILFINFLFYRIIAYYTLKRNLTIT